tara:strand:- start:285 stop:593 length:309 start_codon:yes stop_codon:yes gene_type:complete
MPRKKKVKREKKKIGLDELGGHRPGDFIYCFRIPDKVLSRGKITYLFKTPDGEIAEFIDEITGQFRATLLSDIIENPTRSQINSTNNKIASKIRRSKENKKK